MNYKSLSSIVDAVSADQWFREEASDETLCKIFNLDFEDDTYESEVVRRWNRLSEKEKFDTWQRHKND